MKEIIQNQIKAGGSYECILAMAIRRGLILATLLLFVAGCGQTGDTETPHAILSPVMSNVLSQGKTFDHIQLDASIVIEAYNQEDGVICMGIRLNGTQSLHVSMPANNFIESVIEEPDWVLVDQAIK